VFLTTWHGLREVLAHLSELVAVVGPLSCRQPYLIWNTLCRQDCLVLAGKPGRVYHWSRLDNAYNILGCIIYAHTVHWSTCWFSVWVALDFHHQLSERDLEWSVGNRGFSIFRVDLYNTFGTAKVDLDSGRGCMVLVVVFVPEGTCN